jgi:hypothetical protein
MRPRGTRRFAQGKFMMKRINYVMVLCTILVFNGIVIAVAAPVGDGSTNAAKHAAQKRPPRKRSHGARRRHKQAAAQQGPQVQPGDATRARPVVDGQPPEEAPNLPDYSPGDPRANRGREIKPPARKDRPKRDNP